MFYNLFNHNFLLFITLSFNRSILFQVYISFLTVHRFFVIWFFPIFLDLQSLILSISILPLCLLNFCWDFQSLFGLEILSFKRSNSDCYHVPPLGSWNPLKLLLFSFFRFKKKRKSLLWSVNIDSLNSYIRFPELN